MTNEKKAFGKPLVGGEVRRVEGLIILTRRYNGTQDRISNRWKNRPLKGVKVSRAHLRINLFFLR